MSYPDPRVEVLRAAGHEEAASLLEQIDGEPGDDVAQQLAKLTERVDALTEARGSQPADPDGRQLRSAEALAAQLSQAQSPWFSLATQQGGKHGEE